MEQQANHLVAVLKSPNVALDTKIDLINKLKAFIKHHAVPEAAIPPTTEVIRLAILSPQLNDAGFATLSHFAKRLVLQNQAVLLAHHAQRLHAPIRERLADAKDRTQTRAVQAFADIWQASPQEVEDIIRDQALTGKSARAKIGGMQWVVKVHGEHGLQFRSFVPRIVQCLEDADGTVRDNARETIIHLFGPRNAPDHAKLDLQKQMDRHGVRKAIVERIQAAIFLDDPMSQSLSSYSGPSLSNSQMSASQALTSQTSFSSQGKENVMPSRPKADSQPLESAALPPPVPASTKAELDPTRPLTVQSNGTFHLHRSLTAENKDRTVRLEDQLRDMAPAFEGNESERNWTLRETNILILRKLANGNAPTAFANAFLGVVRGLIDGILKSVNSLRTSLSTHGCMLVKEIAHSCGAGMDPMVEILLPPLVKLCGNTKNIAAQNANATITAILGHVTFNSRLLQHILNAAQDKNVRPRGFAAGWLTILINTHMHHKNALEHNGGADTIEKILQKGLGDADPGVRGNARESYWTFNAVWPTRGESIMASLKPAAQTQLLKHPSNPDPTAGSQASGTAAAKSNFSKSAGVPSNRPSIRETMMASRKAKAVPERPDSAQGAASMSSVPQKVPPRPATAMAMGSLSSAPKRPLKTARKADSPKTSRQLPPSPAKSFEAPRIESSQRAQPYHRSPIKVAEDSTRTVSPKEANHGLQSPIKFTKDTKETRSSPAKSMRSIARSENSRPGSSSSFTPTKKPLDMIRNESLNSITPSSSPTKAAEDFTMIVPPNRPTMVDRSPSPLAEKSLLKDATLPIEATVITAPVPTPTALATQAAESLLASSEVATPTKEAKPEELKSPSSFRNLDAHGYRKVQKMIEGMSSIRFVQLAVSIVENLGSSDGPRDDRLLLQQVATLHKMLDVRPSSFLGFVPACVGASIDALGRQDGVSHAASVLRDWIQLLLGLPGQTEVRAKTVSLMVASIKAREQKAQAEAYDALAEMVQRDPEFVTTVGNAAGTLAPTPGTGDVASASAGAGVGARSGGLADPASLPTITDAMLQLVVDGMSSPDVATRRNAVALGQALFRALRDSDRFWKSMAPLEQDAKTLLMYYIGKENMA